MNLGFEWIATALLLASDLAAAPPLGRVSALEGQLVVLGEGEAEEILLTVNSVLRSGDAVGVPPGSFAEIELAEASFLHLAGGSELDLVEEEGRVIATLHQGAVVAWRNPTRRAELRLVGLGALVDLTTGAVVRLDVARDQLTGTAICRAGQASIWLGDQEEQLAAGAGLWFQPGRRERLTERELEPDALDEWSLDRQEQVRRANGDEVELIGGWELEGHGDWLVVDGQRCFRPAVDVGWRPYHAGGWAWVEPWGWVWTPTASWEFVTHHYGRWHFHRTHGWLWLPLPGWGPAFVAWTLVGPYAGWAPLDPWGYTPYYSAGWGHASGWYFFVELGYFFGGGGCPRRGHTTVVVEVDATVIATHDPAPVDPGKDLVPDDAPGASDRDPNRSMPATRDIHREGRTLGSSTKQTGRTNQPRLTPPRPRPAEAQAAARVAARPSYSGVTTWPRPELPAPDRARPAETTRPNRRPLVVPKPRPQVTATRTPASAPGAERAVPNPAPARASRTIGDWPPRAATRPSAPVVTPSRPSTHSGWSSGAQPSAAPRYRPPGSPRQAPRSTPALRSHSSRPSPAPNTPPPAKPAPRADDDKRESKRESTRESRPARK